MDNNSQFQLRESGATSSTPVPTVDPIDTTSSGTGDSSTTTTTSTTGTNTGDNGGGAVVTTPTNTDDNTTATTVVATPIVEPIPEKPETGYEKAEKYANLSIRWAIVLVMLGLTYNLVKQYRVAKPTAPIA